LRLDWAVAAQRRSPNNLFQKNAEREPAKAPAWPDGVVYNPLRRFCAAIGIIRKLIAANSLTEKPCLDGLRCHPFCDLARSGRPPSIIPG